MSVGTVAVMVGVDVSVGAVAVMVGVAVSVEVAVAVGVDVGGILPPPDPAGWTTIPNAIQPKVHGLRLARIVTRDPTANWLARFFGRILGLAGKAYVAKVPFDPSIVMLTPGV